MLLKNNAKAKHLKTNNIMKTFALFMVLLQFITILLFFVLPKEWSESEIIIQSTLLAYIMQQYLTEEFKFK